MAKKDRDEPIEQDDEDTSIAVNDAWTGMLVISLLALMIGTGLLTWDYLSYPDNPPPTPKFSTADAAPKAAPPPPPVPAKDGAAK